MKNYAFCPVSSKMVNERVARLNATITTLIILLFLFTSNVFVMGFLVIDFLIRAIDRPGYSPMAITSKGVAKAFSIRPKMINAGPKIFAARIGLVFSAAVVVLTITGFTEAALIIASVLGLFSLLEAALGFCVACKIYPFIYRWVY
jgi:hypothetical protein